MTKVDSTNGKVEFQFCIDVDEGYNRTTRSVYKNEAGEYYLIESEEYHIGSAYDYIDVYYALDRSEVEYFEKIAAERERQKKEEALERERIAREDQERSLFIYDYGLFRPHIIFSITPAWSGHLHPDQIRIPEYWREPSWTQTSCVSPLLQAASTLP